jgi:magnesium-transporting ATPase (P-type)
MFVTTPGSDPLVRSYLFLRSGIGIIGVALPFVLVIGTVILNRRLEVSDSMSAYYYSVTGNVFVGSLWAIAIFLICYQYDHLDNIVSNIAGFCAIGLSLFPTTPDGVTATQQQEMIGKAHFLFATSFLVALAFMAFFLFTRENPEKDKVTDTDRKRKRLRNMVYQICGIAMAACIVLAAIILFVPYLSDNRWQHQYHPILIIEVISTLAFGIAWFVKGETLEMLKAVIQRRPLSLR